jgi:hypothetical protein
MKCPHCAQEIEIRFTKAPQQQYDNGVKDTDTDDIGGLLEACQSHPMTNWEETFVIDLRTRFKQYGSRTKVSEKQMGILRKIASGQGGRERNEEF